MKIMQINCVYAKGSTGKIVRDIYNSLYECGIESVVCYGRGDKVNGPNIHKTCGELYSKINNLLSRITGLMYGGCYFSTKRLMSIIKKESPDIVHLHCLNGYFVNIYRLITWLKEQKIKTVLTLHAEFMHTGNCGYALNCEKWKTGCGSCPRLKAETKSLFFDQTARSWQKMKEAFDGFNTLKVVGVSDWITARAAAAPILSGHQIMTIHNGIDLSNFSPAANELDDLIYDKYHLPRGKKIVIHITPAFSNPVKGGHYFKELAEQLTVEYQPVVVGSKEKISDRIISIPFVSNQSELAALYRQAEVMVITSTADNYPTVCIEANCCGTPVVGFDVGGVRETIGHGLGTVVPAFDIQSLISAVMFWCEQKKELPLSEIGSRRLYCDYRRMTQEYINLYESFLL